ncbi:nucleotidyltransferase family protein [bacterium]|nr:nucleotidyltransferase family protein [bacterium]
MKAFLLAAGEGKRLRPMTLKMPKCLVRIGDKPLLEIWLKILAYYHISEVLINTYYLADQVDQFIESFHTPMKVVIAYEPEPLGSGGTLRKIRAFVQDGSPFFIIYADNFTTVNLNHLVDFHHIHRGILSMGLFHAKDPGACGLLSLNRDNRIIDFEEKPQNPSGDLANAGIMVATPDFIDEIPEKVPCDLSKDVLPKLVGRMYGKVIDEYFIDIGTPENYQTAQFQYQKLKNDFPFLK